MQFFINVSLKGFRLRSLQSSRLFLDITRCATAKSPPNLFFCRATSLQICTNPCLHFELGIIFDVSNLFLKKTLSLKLSLIHWLVSAIFPAHDLEQRPEDGVRVVVGHLLLPPRLSREVRLVLLAGPQNNLGVLSRPSLICNQSWWE